MLLVRYNFNKNMFPHCIGFPWMCFSECGLLGQSDLAIDWSQAATLKPLFLQLSMFVEAGALIIPGDPN